MPQPKQYHHWQSGISLVEISIGLVIVGLLLGALMAGRHLIERSELNSITSQLGELKTQIYQFQDQYGALPGDIAHATTLWAGVTNGNGDAVINSTATGSGNPESLQAWLHLGRAQLIRDSFTGLSASSSPFIRTKPSSTANVPSTGLGFYYLWNPAALSSSIFDISNRNMIHFGRINPVDQSVTASALSPQQARYIDQKIDDGLANQGSVYGVNGTDQSGGSACSADSSITNGANYASTSNNTPTCRLIFWLDTP